MVVKRSASYGLDRDFERAVAALCVTSRRFWGLVGHDVDPEMVRDRACSLVIASCAACARDGAMPSPLIAIQRIRRWHEEGKVEEDALYRARLLLLDALEDEAGHDAESVAAELAPVLRRAAESKALDAGYEIFARKGDLVEVERLLAGARRIGRADVSIGSRLGPAAVDRVANTGGDAAFLPTGIVELDAECRGLRRGSLGIALGGTNAGKSMFLDCIAAEAISNKTAAAIATLELSSEDHEGRIIGNLVDLPATDIALYENVKEQARERMQALEDDGLLAFLTCKDFTARATSVLDIESWLVAEESFYQVEIPLVLIDYPSLLCDPSNKVRHEEVTAVAEQLRAFARRTDRWVWGAHQATGEGMNTKKTKRLDNYHAADSKGVPKTADLLVTLNPRDEGETIVWFVAKNRNGPRGAEVGPLPTDFARGRVVATRREGWPW